LRIGVGSGDGAFAPHDAAQLSLYLTAQP
jgi:hypothetical protein